MKEITEITATVDALPLEPTPPDPGVSAEQLFMVHCAIVDAASVLDKPLALHNMSADIQRIWWGLALAARLVADPHAHEPPLPPGVSAEEAERIRGEVRRVLLERRGGGA